jgi:phenylalanyl-tRNA synthetase beta chain
LEDTGIPISQAHRLVNATNAEQEYFRPGLLPGMLEAIVFNTHRKASSLKLFEIGNRLVQGREETVLAIALYGVDENWAKKSTASFYDLKGVVEQVLDRFGIHEPDWNGETGIFGSYGEVSPAVLRNWDIPHAVYYGEIQVSPLFEAPAPWTRVRAVPRFPAVRRDIAFIIDNRVSVKDLETAMRNASSPYFHSVVLFDQFTGKNVPEGKRSLAFSLSYQKEDGTFTDAEIQDLQQKVGESLKRLYQVEFR